MISREWMEPAIAVAEEEWHRGRVADPTLAPAGVPDLSHVTGYSLDDVRYNCVGWHSPAQRRLQRRAFAGMVVGLAISGGFTAFFWAVGAHFPALFSGILLAAVTLKTLVDAGDTWAGAVSQVDGDVTTEIKRDSEDGDRYFVHIYDFVRLEITKEAYLALVPGGPYRIFYLQGPEKAIGGQVLPGWRPLPLPQPDERKKRWWDRFNVEISC